MTKKIGLIIKMPTEQASKVEIEERKSKFYNLLARWAFEAYIKDNGRYVQETRTSKNQ